MKVNKFLLAGVAVLGLGMTACNDDDVPPVGNPAEGSTFAGMYISTMKDVMTKAVNDSQGDYAGREAESKLETLRFISPGKTKDWTLGQADEEDKFWATTVNGTYTVAPWKVTAGSQAMALLFNRGNLEPGIATATNYVYGNTATAVADITALASENKFVMASSVEQKTIQDNISKETVKTGTEEAQNVFSFDMERVVSQGMVAKGDNLNTETTMEEDPLILTTSRIRLSTAPQRHIFSATMRESVQSRRVTGFTKILHPPLMTMLIFKMPKPRMVQPGSIWSAWETY